MGRRILLGTAREPEASRMRGFVLTALAGNAVAVLSLLIAVFAFQSTSLAAGRSEPAWIGVWGAAPALPSGSAVQRQTIRQIVRLSLGGQALRIRLTNELGSNPLVIGTVHMALPGPTLGSIDPTTDHVLTFGGQRSLVIQPGMPMISDPLMLKTNALQELVVSLFIKRYTGPTATHPSAMATTFLSDDGEENDVAAPTLKNATTSTERFFISGIEVLRQGGQTVVTLGDSITDGDRSTSDQNHRWPDFLADRLVREQCQVAVVNAGISGNRILHDVPALEYGPSALARLDRDVLSVAGVRTVFLLESINDIGIPGSSVLPEQTVSSADIIAGMIQIVTRAHARGVRAIGATLLPFAGTIYPGYYSAVGESTRQSVNQWIRNGRAFDGVVDLDAAMRDPAHPDQLAPAYDSGDHIHPNDLGYRKIADTVDLPALAGNERCGTSTLIKTKSR
jgi:lysophospholipase L1-like esterase